MTLFHILLILGVAVLSMALRSFASVLAQKLGALGVLAASFLAGWFLTGSQSVGIFCAVSWLLLPWLEILTRVRKLRLPLEKNLRHRPPPSREIFPVLPEATTDIEEEGFEHVEDAGWDWEDYQQFFRLFYKASDRTQAALCLIDQGNITFSYLSISSRAKDGKVWTTWNYPFSYSLQLVPHWRTKRVLGEVSFFDLYEHHRDWLRRNGITIDQLHELAPDTMQEDIQTDLRAQITHNLATGVLKKTEEGQIRYSWRGLFFIWFQFLRDLVRLS